MTAATTRPAGLRFSSPGTGLADNSAVVAVACGEAPSEGDVLVTVGTAGVVVATEVAVADAAVGRLVGETTVATAAVGTLGGRVGATGAC